MSHDYGAHPIHPILPVNRYLTEALPSLGIGFAVGLGALLALRAARLRFTWGLLAAPLLLPAEVIGWEPGLALSLALAIVLGLGAYMHLEDERRGGEQARAARETLGPARYLRARRAWRASATTAGEPRAKGDRLALGSGIRGGVCAVPFGAERGVHALVLGATGSGKTVTQAAIAQAYVLAGAPAIVVDPKGDAYLRGVLEEAAAKVGKRLWAWSPTGPSVYNPLERGSPTEIADKALAGHEWSEPRYELATLRLLGKALATMRAAGEWPPTLSTLTRYMHPDRLDLLAAKVGGELADSVADYVDGLSARAKADLDGGRNRLAILAEGELGPWLDPALGAGPVLSLAEVLRRGDIAYLHLDSDRYPAASKLLGAALVIDLVTLTADLHGQGVRGLVVIDEFAALAAEHVHRLFGRARSAGLGIVLGTQSLADLRSARPDDPTDSLTEQVLTNVEFCVVHREADPDSAERLARVAGTEQTWVTTTKVGGRRENWWSGPEGSRTPERQFVVPPDRFKRLRPGEAVVIAPTAKRPGQVVKVWRPQEVER
jgi:type IV secretory pathway TraG/TraD family ATPase VirD4